MFKFIFVNAIISLLLIFLILLIISFFTLWERKLLAGIQRRHGPVFVGIFGLLQPFADGLKLVLKVFNTPSGVYYYIFLFSSILSLTLSLLSWSVIPFNSFFVFSDINLGLLFILVISSLNVYTIMFSGWSSNSKYGVLGSIRSGAQMISYELPMSLSILPLILISSTANLTNLVIYQKTHFWFIFLFMPFALIFFIAMLAETNRTPFDLPEAESELVAGYNMEYSALSFAVFFLAEYNHILLMSVLFVILFLGGWDLFHMLLVFIKMFFLVHIHIIWIIYKFFIYVFFRETFIGSIFCYYFFGSWGSSFAIWKIILKIQLMCMAKTTFNFLYIFETSVLIIKSFSIASIFVIIRASVPRYKFVQLISICWEVFIPVLLMLFFFFLLIFYANSFF